MPVEVAPIAHYHMGGVATDARMATEVPGLLAAGEAVGGANGANRLSGNAITEALVFGRQAGRTAAERAKTIATLPIRPEAAQETLDLVWTARTIRRTPPKCCSLYSRPWQRTSDRCAPSQSLKRALGRIDELTRSRRTAVRRRRAFDMGGSTGSISATC